MFAHMFKGCRFPILNISTVARVVGELRVGAAVGGGVPYVKVHVRPKWVEAGELVWSTSPLQLPAKRRMRWSNGRHGGGPFRLKVALVGITLRGPDGSEQAGHGREAARPREVWLWRTETPLNVCVLQLNFECNNRTDPCEN